MGVLDVVDLHTFIFRSRSRFMNKLVSVCKPFVHNSFKL
ncbi:hypothetical protein WVIC16_110081 [Weissella viridescens]|nr:hypothetical protein WVIC16_110081 [Weissella viridescens]